MAQVLTAPEMPNELSRMEQRFPSKNDVVQLAGAAKTVTVPVSAAGKPVASWVCLKVVGDIVHIASSGAAAPTTDTMDGANDGSASWALEAQDGPRWYSVRGLTSFSVISDAAWLYISWFREPGDGT